MARRSQCSSAGDNPLHPNYLPPHYREEYRLAVDALVEADLDGYYEFLQRADVVDFLSPPEIDYIQGSVQLPQQSNNPEHPYLDSDGEGSSDTYWPVHSDLEVPGLDLGWPQFHHSSGPTEVTTLVNPPEPDMPSIKEQARRLIKSAQQVIGIVMDMFTDVDILADILSAAMRNVAVYIILDEQNANHFLNMVNNCRVNLQGLQFLRVRVVSGITYHCRSGKSFKGQMMDRFLLTDCRAVLSGNYSFMWSFEKLHRCMAHLFLGQLVSTFDEEFRILFAQSQPLAIDTRPPQMEEFGLISKRTYPNIKTHLHREPRKFLSMDIPGQDDWTRQSYDDRMDLDWRAMQIKRQEAMTGPADMYNRFSPQQSRMDYDQGHSRMPKMDNSAFKRHSYAEGGQGRYSLPFMQAPELDPPSRQLDRGPQLNMGPESDYSGYDKFWNQDYHQMEPYPEKSFLPDLGPTDAFDPVANYLSSTRNRDFDQGQDKLQIPGDFNNRRSNVYQTSPTPSSTMEEKPFGQESTADRKDPLVKRGLRNWRINSYLCANDNPGDEGPSLTPPLAQDPFEEPPYGVQPKPQGMELSLPKIPNVREFRVPAIPRASQIPSYAKMSEQTKRSAEENAPAATKTPAEPKPTNQAETKTHGVTRTQSPLTLSETKAPALPPEIKTTPCPSESSSTTTDGEKPEELEQKEPISGLLRREESFRRKYNPGVQRSSRLRSSLIFSSLEQTEQQDEDSDKKETDLMKLSFASKRPAREPFKWTPKLKSTTLDSSSTNAEKTEGDESSKEEKSKDSAQKTSEPSSKGTDAEQRDVAPGPKPSQPEPPSVSLLHTSPFLDMNDPDQRLMFFKELAAKRRAAKAAEAEKSSEATKAPEVKNNIEPQKSQKPPESSSVNSSEVKEANQEAVKVQVDTSQSCDGVSTDSEKMKQKISQLATATHISEDAQSHDPPELPRPADVTTQATPKIPEKLDVVLSPVRSTAEPQIQESQDLESDAPSSCSTVICGGTKSDPNPPTSTPEPAAGEENTSSDCSSVTPSTSSCPAENQNTSKDVPAPEVELYISEEPSPPPSVRPAEEPVRPPDTEKESTQASESTSLDTDSSCCQSSSLAALNTDDTSLLSTDTPTSGEGPRAQETDADDTTPGPPSEDTIADVTPVDSLTPDTKEPVTPTPSPVGVLTDPVTQETPPCEPDPTGAQSSDELEDSVEPDDVKTKTPTEMHESSEPTLTPVSTENGLEPESEKNLNPPEPADDEKELVEKDESETTVKESAQDKTSDQAKSEKTDEAPPPPSQPKQTKSRYHSSTANVISSSNLRDDTKLLLGQISANNQSRSEMSKEAPVTDDEKEDEADKKANVGTKSRGKQKTPQERQMLLEKIQSMRKERKVYSRFEMAP